MTDRHETTPYEGEPDEFDLIAGELEAMEDPYLLDIHREARLYEEMIQDSEDDAPFIRKEIIEELDAKWRYMRETVEVVGKGWMKVTPEAETTQHSFNGEKLKSHGFTFYDMPTGEEGRVTPKIGHFLETKLPDDMGTAYVFFPLEDIHQFVLPFPSPEAREHRFAYYHKKEADWIDDLAFTSRREDQVLSSLREFYFDADLTDKNGAETLRDAEEYLRRRAEIEPLANYRISIIGDIISVDEKGNGTPARLKRSYTVLVHINNIFLRPADVTADTVKGLQAYVPFIDVVALLDNGQNPNVLVPCRSIALVYSERHNGAP